MLNDDVEIERLLNGSIEHVLERLGREIYRPPLGAFPPRVAEFVAAAREWLAEHREALCVAIRNNASLRSYVTGRGVYKASQIVAILGDLIALVCRLPVAGAGWASVSLLHLGLDQFCGSFCCDSPDAPTAKDS